ncbi:dTMP kinase [Patescibacteria group bacterium]
MKKGKFIVIDGTDGSGKATQAKELVSRLKRESVKVKTVDFPRYEDNFFGKFIGECLTGEYGDFIKIHPKIVSTLYAADRFESSEQIRKWIDRGYVVIADRYASSNQIHQGGKIENPRERRRFLNWLEEMEFSVFKIPKPDLIFYLSVPVKVSQGLLKNEDNGKKKGYQKGKADLAEKDLEHQEKARKSAMRMVEESNNWVKVGCTRCSKMRSIEDIHRDIFEKTISILKK